MELDDFLNVGEYLRQITIYQRFIELYNRIKLHH